MIWVINANVLENYKVFVEFNDNLSGIIDFRTILENDTRLNLRELLDLDKFNTCRVDYDTLCWSNGVDFAPEYLYEQINKNKQVA